MGRFRLAAIILVLGCPADHQEIPAGAIAVVGEVVLEPQDVLATHTQLDAYGQLRFRGPEGTANLLQPLVDTELLAQEAVDAGLGDDPRVLWSLVEEQAVLFLGAELERRDPRERIAADRAALAEYLARHAERFRRPERRSVVGVTFPRYEPAEAALVELRAGTKRLEDFGEPVSTPLQARDDMEFPGFHALVFDPALDVGAWVERPILVSDRVMVARIAVVEPAVTPGLDDPAVLDRVVDALVEERRRATTEALLAELEARYPLVPRP